MSGLTIGSLCTGILGLDRAVAEHFGAELAWYSEVEPAACTIIEREHPDVPNLGDLTVVDWSTVPPVDILTAGYPCQPFSHAGKRKGASDARHLWPYIIDAVRVLRPRWVVAENVRGHLSLGFDRVLWSLAEAGFDAEWCVLRASDVGATHQRARVFLVASDADRAGAGRDARGVSRETTEGRRAQLDVRPARDAGAPSTDADGVHDDRRRNLGPGGWTESSDGDRDTAHTDGAGFSRSAQQHGPTQADGEEGSHRGHAHRCRLENARCTAVGQDEPPAVEWGKYAPAIDRWAGLVGRPAPHPVDEKGRLNPALVEWMMGYPEGWVAELPRTKALKALGNAVVTQQALAALRELVPMVDVAEAVSA